MSDPVPGRQLLIASTGGHLAQLVKWAPRLGSDHDSLWVTFASPQSDSLLRGRRVLYVPYVAPRDVVGTAKAFSKLMKEIDWQDENFSSAVSTGAALALAGLGAARLHRIPSFYFESVSRVHGPSLTGRLIALNPRIATYCQYPQWAGKHWKFRGSLFDDYVRIPKGPVSHPRLFITLGTIQPYRFDSLVDQVLSTGLADDRAVWQLGATTRSDLPGRSVTQMTREEFEQCARNADVVITHSGVGTLMELLDMGIFPVVVPRRAERSEHVDNHQLQVAEVLTARGISAVCEVADLHRETIVRASSCKIGKHKSWSNVHDGQ